MRDRTDDNLLTRLLLFLWLPLAALVGLVPLERDEDGLADDDRTESAVWQAELSMAGGLWDPPERPDSLPFRSVVSFGGGSQLRTRPEVSFLELEPVTRRAAYTSLLRHQLLRLPDANTPVFA